MHLTENQLRGMDEAALEEYYDWFRHKYKSSLRAGDYAWAHSFNACCGDITLELSRRYRWQTPVPVSVSDAHLFDPDDA